VLLLTVSTVLCIIVDSIRIQIDSLANSLAWGADILSNADILENVGDTEILFAPLSLECVLLGAKRVFCNRRFNSSVYASHYRIQIGDRLVWNGVSLSG
jgi:hypothetical protein